MLHVGLLGPLMVRDADGRDLTPHGTRERNGLATLAIVAPEPVSTERLAVELYRERDTADPRNAVQAMVSRLRRGLGRSAGSVETTATGYRLVDVTLDLDEAEALLRESMGDRDHRRAAERLDRARRLWRGPTLDGLDGEMIGAERLRLDGLRCDAEDAVLERRLTANGRTDSRTHPAPGPDLDLVADLEAATRAEPLREQRWELLMLALYRAGRQADALRAYQRARDLLADHLGLEPGPRLAELERRILDHDPTLAPEDLDGAGPTVTRTADLPAGTVSVLLCDVEGSVRRWEIDPADTATEIVHLHHLWSAAVAAEAGTVVKSTGDGILAVFTTADGAVRAAAAAMVGQDELALRVRAAIHTGSLEPVDDDYRGPVINRCARLLELASGGQILTSGPTAELARGPLATSGEGRPESNAAGNHRLDEAAPEAETVSLRELGRHWLRDVPEPMPIWQVTGPGLRASFPPLPSRDPATLPRPRGRLLGRSDLVERVVGLVAEDRLVTLLGPGGIGKTSVALAVAWRIIGGRPVTFVDLARVEDPAAVGHRLADAVCVDHDVDDDVDPADRIADRLVTGTDLVVIDNAEHVLDAVAVVVDRVLARQLKGSFLVTSRQPLGLPDEVIVGVPPLDVPDDDDDLTATGRSPSVELFIDRARAGQPDFRLADGLLPVVAHICRRLDGIPLAIELAAGRASLLSIDDIAARLDDQLRLLRQVRSQRERRHRSLEAVVRWSVDQLSDHARDVFVRLSVMAGGFGLDGLERVVAGGELATGDGSTGDGATIDVALEAVDELNGASLLTVEPGGSRFRMLEPIRQFAATELASRGLEDSTRRAHARWIAGLATSAHLRRDESRAPALASLDVEADQILAALTWVADTGQADLAGPLAYPLGWWYLTRDARTGEGLLRRMLDVVDRDADPLGWAQVVLGLGIATATHPRSEVAERSVEAVAIFDRHDHPDRGVARLAAAFAQTVGSDVDLPFRLLAEADRLTPSDDRWARALVGLSTMTLRSLALSLVGPDAGGPNVDVSDLDTIGTMEIGRQAIATFRSIGERWAIGVGLSELGRLHQWLGDLDAAEACYLESLELLEDDEAHGSHYVLTELGRMASDQGQFDRADRYHAEAMRIAELDGNGACLAMSQAGMAHAAEARGLVDDAIDLYRQAIDRSGDSIIEMGRTEWQARLDRLEAARR